MTGGKTPALVSEGEYKIKITAQAQNETVGTSVFATQSIFINFSASNIATDTKPIIDLENPDQVPVDNLDTDITIEAKITNLSTHSEPEELSSFNSNSPFKVSAGRERLAYVGTRVEFAESHKGTEDSSISNIFNWSFGDGFQAFGNRVEHAYKFPGEYNVVLNAGSNDSRSISRTKVKVLLPNLSINYIDGGIKITNHGQYEINVGDFILVEEIGSFVIAKDTIIAPNKFIEISLEDVKLNMGELISLKNPSGNVILSTAPSVEPVLATVSKPEEKAESQEIKTSAISKVNPNKPIVVATVLESIISTSSVNSTSSVVEKSPGFFKGIWGGITKIARIFYNI